MDLLDKSEDLIHLYSTEFCYIADVAVIAGGSVLSLDLSMPCQECYTDFGAYSAAYFDIYAQINAFLTSRIIFRQHSANRSDG